MVEAMKGLDKFALTIDNLERRHCALCGCRQKLFKFWFHLGGKRFCQKCTADRYDEVERCVEVEL